MALDVEAENLIANIDSQLVTKQVEGEYEVKEERMKGYLQEIGELTSRLKSFQLYQIPRIENTEADYLARLTNSLVNCSTHNITVRTLVKNRPKSNLITIQVETDWRKPLLDYLERSILPANEKDASRLKNRATRYGLPRVLISDNGCQFQGGKIQIGVLSKAYSNVSRPSPIPRLTGKLKSSIGS
ncbi:UNVERIFIED_CONTAM: hypothetical protein Sradi_2381200 [Sesamum radiatum]|uniref:RNase H type-1 domain-containing protein n=1 Tax=Sesamum radiatum TaxID=300843 RepID=A0AAW2T6M3_SESRA